MIQLDSAEIATLAPDLLLASLGKRVLHPGGRQATQALLQRVRFQVGHHVLDIGCGVGTTAIEIARRSGIYVTAADIAPLMLDMTRENVARAGLKGVVRVEKGNITSLKYPNNTFDCVIAEGVSPLVDHRAAIGELTRVCKPGAPVLLTDFFWRRPPSPEAEAGLRTFLCHDHKINSPEEWMAICQDAGLEGVEIASGPFDTASLRGLLRDEGPATMLATMARVIRYPAYFRRAIQVFSRLRRCLPFLGYISVSGTKCHPKTGTPVEG